MKNVFKKFKKSENLKKCEKKNQKIKNFRKYFILPTKREKMLFS